MAPSRKLQHGPAPVVGSRRSDPSRRKRRIKIYIFSFVGAFALAGASAAWIGFQASIVSKQLNDASALVTTLKDQIAKDDVSSATETADRVREKTAAANDAARDPIWTLAASLPVLGPNLSAISEVARAADDVANLGLRPLIGVYGNLDWKAILPASEGTDLKPLQAASPKVSAAAQAVRSSADRLGLIDTSKLLPQVKEPLNRAKEQLSSVTGTLDAAASASQIAPPMMGVDSPRSYLLMIQNNAETRATGGIPGALAILTVDNGKLSLGAQSSASELGVMAPPFPVEAEQQAIYSTRLGKFMQDVNLTPDFPTAALSAKQMWERKTGQAVDGVVAIDPVALSYILNATGPVQLAGPEAAVSAQRGLPTLLSGSNVVSTLLSDVYAKVEQPAEQDAYFAGVAQEVFSALSDGQGDTNGLVQGLTQASEEGRVLIWSQSAEEQAVLTKYPLGGAISGPSVSPAQFGVYFNDGTGAKMDYYVKRTVQLVKECPKDGYEETTVRITSTNTAAADAATALPAYVTGKGQFGVPAGSVQTNIVAYGPVQANVETAKVDGLRTGFAPYLHDNRPVGVLAVILEPGETTTVEFKFGKIVQHTEPDLFVTPTVQAVNDVKLATQPATCT